MVFIAVVNDFHQMNKKQIKKVINILNITNDSYSLISEIVNLQILFLEFLISFTKRHPIPNYRDKSHHVIFDLQTYVPTQSETTPTINVSNDKVKNLKILDCLCILHKQSQQKSFNLIKKKLVRAFFNHGITSLTNLHGSSKIKSCYQLQSII